MSSRFVLLCMTEFDRAIAALAEGQYGVFTASQAKAIGFTRDQRDKRVRAGRWSIEHPGIYRMAGVPLSWRGQVLADCWSVRGLAVASHRSAALLWNLPGGSEAFVEITCDRWRRSRRPNLIVHETLSLRTDDVATIDCIPVTTVEQTLLGLAAVAGSSIAEMALDRALHQKLTTRKRLDAFVCEKGARGRNGVGVLRALLEAHDPLAAVPESVMETRMKQLLRRHGLPTPVFQYVIRHQGEFVARVDAAYPELRIAIEYDSYEHHTGRDAIVRDNDRRNVLRRIEWALITFTAADIANDGGQAIKALQTARSQAFGVTSAP
jgi:very-short-patch-repair endonuclease